MFVVSVISGETLRVEEKMLSQWCSGGFKVGKDLNGTNRHGFTTSDLDFEEWGSN